MVGLDDLADREIAELRRRLEDADDWNDRLDLAETFVLERLRRGPELSRAVVSAYRELAFCHGNIRIEAIATRLGWSRKHLSQRFQDEIGLSPKSLARMMRFNRALDLAQPRPTAGLGRPRRRMRLCRPGASDARIRANSPAPRRPAGRRAPLSNRRYGQVTFLQDRADRIARECAPSKLIRRTHHDHAANRSARASTRPSATATPRK